MPDEEHALQVNHVRHVLAVASGKGGVGKSLVSGLAAVELARRGLRAGILDADITGPSIPRLFGVTARPEASMVGIVPPETPLGIRIISMNLFLEDAGQPVIWRGPLLTSAIKQFWTDVVWEIWTCLWSTCRPEPPTFRSRPSSPCRLMPSSW